MPPSLIFSSMRYLPASVWPSSVSPVLTSTAPSFGHRVLVVSNTVPHFGHFFIEGVRSVCCRGRLKRAYHTASIAGNEMQLSKTEARCVPLSLARFSCLLLIFFYDLLLL